MNKIQKKICYNPYNAYKIFDALFFLLILDKIDMDCIANDEKTGVWNELFKD